MDFGMGRFLALRLRAAGVGGAAAWIGMPVFPGIAIAVSIALFAPFEAPAQAAAQPAPVGLSRSKRPEAARVYFITPKEGQALRSPIVVRFGLSQLGVAPAGVEKPDTGHHHLLIDSELPPFGLPIPKSDRALHFGNGQTETTLELPPGKHTLQLLVGDHNHVPHDPPIVSERITIEIVK